MTKYLIDSSGNPDVMSEESAKVWYHTTSAVYFFPLLGAIISDWFWVNIERFFISLLSIAWDISLWHLWTYTCPF